MNAHIDNRLNFSLQTLLPAKPYCTDNLKAGIYIRARTNALQRAYIQPNGPTHKRMLVFDVDKAGAAYLWDDLNLPAPNLAVENPKNKHAHLIYVIAPSLRINAENASLKSLRYCQAIEKALLFSLGADRSYSGLICKNPYNERWKTHVFETDLYNFDWLADYKYFEQFSQNAEALNDKTYGLGRNCTLFDELRAWAYRAIRQGWPSHAQWLLACTDRAKMLNAQFETPLDMQEVSHTAKSVAKWTFANFDKASFSAWQAAQGAKSKGGGRASKKEECLPLALKMINEQGYTQAETAEQIGVGLRTLERWLHK